MSASGAPFVPEADGFEPPETRVESELDQVEAAQQNTRQSAFRRYISDESMGIQSQGGDGFEVNRRKSLLLRATVGLSSTVSSCGTPTCCSSDRAAHPERQAITIPSVGTRNGGLDNDNSDLILYVEDMLQSSSGYNYRVIDLLGQGTFGQVARCMCKETGEMVAVKVIKNQQAYYNQACMEVRILQLLNHGYDPNDQRHIVRLVDNFVHCGHLCLVFELLYVNLYELLKHNQFQGLSMNLIRVLIAQILDTLIVLREAKVIHCDLKPENVLLKGSDSGEIKTIDFGSACFENRTVYSYIQSRFYRSPEVLLGHPYTVAIDMWSFGCLAAELFLGLPLFPGASEYDLLLRIVEMLGMPPAEILGTAKNTTKYFATVPGAAGGSRGQVQYRLMSQQEVEAYTKQAAPLGKRYFKHTALADIIGSYPMAEIETPNKEPHTEREAFLDLLLGVLDLDPRSSWTPRQAMQHPFVTGSPFTGPFQPEQDPLPMAQQLQQQGAAGSPIPITSMPMGGSLPASRWGAIACSSSGIAMGYPSQASGSLSAAHGFSQQYTAATAALAQSAPHNLHYGYNNAIAAAAAAAAAAVAAASWQQPAPTLSSSWQQLHSLNPQPAGIGSAPQVHGFASPSWGAHSPIMGSTMPVMTGGLSALQRQLSAQQQQQQQYLSQSYGSQQALATDPVQLGSSFGQRFQQATVFQQQAQQSSLSGDVSGLASRSIPELRDSFSRNEAMTDVAVPNQQSQHQHLQSSEQNDDEDLEHGDPGDYLPFFSDEQLIEDFSKLQPDGSR